MAVFVAIFFKEFDLFQVTILFEPYALPVAGPDHRGASDSVLAAKQGRCIPYSFWSGIKLLVGSKYLWSCDSKSSNLLLSPVKQACSFVKLIFVNILSEQVGEMVIKKLGGGVCCLEGDNR